MPPDSTGKTIGVALGVCLVCSILVSTAAVTLRGIQEGNKKREKLKNILIAGDLLIDESNIKEIFKEKIQPEIINLNTGQILSIEEHNKFLNLEDFDIKALAKSSEYSEPIPPVKDIAQIKRKPKYMIIYKVKDNDQIDKVILPVYGMGLWSTMYGFIALDKDLKTVKGFTFYEHGETPGLGGEVDNPRWKRKWIGKKVFDHDWNIKIEVIKGQVDPQSVNANYQVDGLSGATITTRGIDQLIKFWLGDNGYGPFIRRLREQG